MTVTKTIGSTGDYATPLLWFVSLGSSLSDDQVGNVQKEEIVVSIDQSLGPGVANNGHYILLTAGPGNGFADNPSKLTDPLRYNSTWASLRRTGPINPGPEGPWTILTYGDMGFKTTRMQYKFDESGGDNLEVQTTQPIGLIDACIICVDAASPGPYFCRCIQTNNGCAVTNSLVYGNSPYMIGMHMRTGNSKSYNNTVINTTTGSPPADPNFSAGLIRDYSSLIDARNTAVSGFYADYDGQGDTGSTNNATDKSSFGGTNFGVNGQTSLVAATEFVSVTTGSEDFRVAGTAVKLPGNGSPTGTPTLDILGQTRSLTAPTIGAFEAGGTPPPAAQVKGGKTRGGLWH